MRGALLLLLAHAVVGALAVPQGAQSAARRSGNVAVTTASPLRARRRALSDAGASSTVHFASAAGEADRVVALPGLPRPAPDEPSSASLYAGYVTVDAAAGRALFYTLQTVQNGDPRDAPLILWLNGGPGCSSVGNGFFSELGPFLPTADGKLKRNAWAWHQAANVLFVESPAFVGFSYSNTSADAVVGDARTASDTRAFLLSLILDKFPGLKRADLYLAGESYAGHYIPTLADAILVGNDAAKAAGQPGNITAGHLRLRGVLIGNPLTDTRIDNYGCLEHWYTHYIISRETFDSVLASCNLSAVGPLRALGGAYARTRGLPKRVALAPDGEECQAAVDAATADMGPVNLYQIFEDVCSNAGGGGVSSAQSHPALPPSGGSARQRTAARPQPSLLASALSLARQFAASLLFGGREPRADIAAAKPASSTAFTAVSSSDDANAAGFPPEAPCIDAFVTDYLNRDDVRKALHVRADAGHWTSCDDDAISYSEEDVQASMLPLYPRLIKAKLRVWIYSGDIDGVVPTSGTRAWVEALRLPMETQWHPWLVDDADGRPQVGGYAVQYERLTFTTVPYSQPARALHMLQAFLNDESL